MAELPAPQEEQKKVDYEEESSPRSSTSTSASASASINNDLKGLALLSDDVLLHLLKLLKLKELCGIKRISKHLSETCNVALDFQTDYQMSRSYCRDLDYLQTLSKYCTRLTSLSLVGVRESGDELEYGCHIPVRAVVFKELLKELISNNKDLKIHTSSCACSIIEFLISSGGCVDSVSLKWDETLTQLLILHGDKLRCLSISDIQHTTDISNHCGLSLESLVLEWYDSVHRFSPGELQQIGEQCKNVKHLDLKNVVVNEVASEFQFFPNLERLSLCDSYFISVEGGTNTLIGIGNICGFLNTSTLTVLSIYEMSSGRELTTEDCVVIATTLVNLKEFRCWEYVPGVCHIVEFCSHLETLMICNADVEMLYGWSELAMRGVRTELTAIWFDEAPTGFSWRQAERFCEMVVKVSPKLKSFGIRHFPGRTGSIPAVFEQYCKRFSVPYKGKLCDSNRFSK